MMAFHSPTAAVFTISLLGAAAPLFAQGSADPSARSAQGDVSVTIYNDNLALVQDVRQLRSEERV
jgi:hypothetical protein